MFDNLDMVENLRINLQYVNDNCCAIVVFGAIMGTTRTYDEANEFIEEFCDENNIDMDSLIIDEE